MKYKILVPFGSLKVGDILETSYWGCLSYSSGQKLQTGGELYEINPYIILPHEIAIMLHTKMIEDEKTALEEFKDKLKN